MATLIERATAADAAAIAAVRTAAARDLTARFGPGTWSFAVDSEDSVKAELLSATILIAREEGSVLGTLKLATKSPYLVSIAGFTTVARPIWLTAMNVLPRAQRQGFGRALVAAAAATARELKGEAIRLDSYDAVAGAGGFWAKCGFREVSRQDYNGTPLIFFEQLMVAGR